MIPAPRYKARPLIIEEKGEKYKAPLHNGRQMTAPIRTVLLYVFSCGPLLLTIAAWLKICLARRNRWPSRIAITALTATSAVAIYSATVSIYYALRPVPPSVPGWQDPFVLDMAMLFFLAPVVGILGVVVAGKRAASAWLIAVIEIASLPLFLLGIMASMLD